jgi:hypothetical protein
MYILASTNIVQKYPYSFNELKQDNPQISFPAIPSVDFLKSWNVHKVTLTDPTYDPATHRIVEDLPKLLNDTWTQSWTIIELTAEEILHYHSNRQLNIEKQRAEAYRNESDPLFFKSQRGEATHQEWLDKVAEIKSRYST